MTHTNRLAGETSPYLLQHAHNPVDWFPWGPAALTKAKDEGKPIFLSIGYAACHWCHVMERESFEDEATAAQLNAAFVAIKVDREERPDLDAIYMDAVQAMTGQGGWPMSVFLTPEGKPFYGGTYFPGDRRYGMPSFREILTGVERVWRDRRADAEEQGERLRLAIDTAARGGMAAEQESHRAAHDGGGVHDGDPPTGGDAGAQGEPTELAPWILDSAMVGFERGFDAVNGGWGQAPKFPQPMSLEALLREHVRTGDARALAMARRSLDAMAAGGIYDHVGGGFARYATDAIWLVPHFEKMLYDNAQLARVYLHAWQLTGDGRYREVVEETLDYVAREMRVAGGAFAASQDADTDGEEGATYVWHATELREILAEDAPLFFSAYGVREDGNWEGHTILSRTRSDAALARDRGTDEARVRERLWVARARLKERRDTRSQPGRDDKALAAWNGLMIAAFADAARALGSGDYRAVAEGAAAFLLDGLRDEHGRLRRSWKDGRASHNGVLEDYAAMAEGLLALYQATFEERWFVAARELMGTVLDHFADPVGGFFDTSDDHEQLITRPKGLQDNATPSGNALAATVLLRLAALTGEARYRDPAEAALRLVAAAIPRYPTAFGQWIVALDLAVTPVDEIAVVGDAGAPDTVALLEVAFAGYRPNAVVACAPDGDASAVPLLNGRPRIDGRATAYVCRGFACQRPVTGPAALVDQLGGR